MWKKVKLLKMSNFTFFHNVFYAICILKSSNSHISLVVCSFFEFGTVSKWCIREWVKLYRTFSIKAVQIVPLGSKIALNIIYLAFTTIIYFMFKGHCHLLLTFCQTTEFWTQPNSKQLQMAKYTAI